MRRRRIERRLRIHIAGTVSADAPDRRETLLEREIGTIVIGAVAGKPGAPRRRLDRASSADQKYGRDGRNGGRSPHGVLHFSQLPAWYAGRILPVRYPARHWAPTPWPMGLGHARSRIVAIPPTIPAGPAQQFAI